MLLGLADDLINLSPAVKFFGQFMIAFSFIRAGLYFKEVFFSELWAIPLSFFWLLVCMNAINLIDVMDGLATTVALSAAFGYLLFALFNGNSATAHVLIIFIGALLAFLYYNRPPAKIYLGDAGSLFLGGFLGVIPFLLSWSTHVSWGFLLAPAPLAIALLELSGLMVIRTAKGIPFFRGSRDHFSHYLQGNGWSKNNILILSATFGFMSVLLATLGYFDLLSLPFTCGGGLSLVALWICLLWKQNKKQTH
jgi:UDP-GlcNAc:undecaprenyl-phosphate GlcNAc-1-phosphate transferase